MNPHDFFAVALHEARRRTRSATEARGLDVLEKLCGRGSSQTRLRIVPRIGTARLRRARGGGFAIEVDPEFVTRQVREPADALHLLGHELLHRVRGDLSRFVRMDGATQLLLNLALDMFVNAHLERIWFRGDGAPYQERLYRVDRFPDVLLLPPGPLLRAVGEWKLAAELREGRWLFGTRRVRRHTASRCAEAITPAFAELGPQRPDLVAGLYGDAWLNCTGFREHWERLRRALAAELPQLMRSSMPVLLGHHGSPFERDAAAEGLRDLLDRHGLLEGGGGPLHNLDVHPDADEPDPGPIFQAITRAFDSDPSNPVVRRRLAPDRAVLGRVGRREALHLALGQCPVFWSAEVEQEVDDSERVHLYLDASGSMTRLLPFLTRLVSTLGEYLGPTLNLFSTEVVEATLAQVARGELDTTGGTDFDAPVEHALERARCRVLVITDGVAQLDDEVAARARAAGLLVYVVLTGRHPRRENPLSALPGKTWCFEAGGQ